MSFRLFNWIFRGYIAAPLGIFEENLPFGKGDLVLLKYIQMRNGRETEAIQKFLTRVRRDHELYDIFRHYDLTEEKIREIIQLLPECGLSYKEITLPFVVEMCAYALLKSTGSEVSDDIRHKIFWAYQSPGFADEEQRGRFAKIFGRSRL